jgi:hypothetical protein
MKLRKFTPLAAVAATLALSTSLGLAQDNAGAGGNQGGQGGGGRRGQGGQGGQGGNFDPAQFQQRMNERLKTSLKATDEEWAVIQPLLEKVQTKQREARAGGIGGGGGGRRGQGGPGGGAPGSQPADQNTQGNQGNRPNRGGGSPEADALSAALQSDTTSADEIKTKLAALRESRKKAQAELEQARADLQKVLTAKQEATLVLMGMLE